MYGVYLGLGPTLQASAYARNVDALGTVIGGANVCGSNPASASVRGTRERRNRTAGAEQPRRQGSQPLAQGQQVDSIVRQGDFPDRTSNPTENSNT